MKCLLFLCPILCFAGASSFTAQENAQVLSELPFENTEDFQSASRGLIAPLPNDGVIKNAKGEIVWDLRQYTFVKEEKAPSTVNPSLWRQAQLLQIAGLFQVAEGIYQVRGADLSNMTIVEGKKGIIVIDTLFCKETAQAAIDLYYQHRPKKPVRAVIYTHSHIDHFGGVKGVISQADVDSGKVKVIAPKGFAEAALTENIMAGTAMGRRAMYMYGTQLEPGPEGQMTSGLGLGTSKGEVTLILPTDSISKTGEERVIDGVRFTFLMAPGSEAPSEMLFYLPEKKALCAAEDATHNMHNIYSLRGARVRDSKAWASYLNQAVELFGSAEVVFSQHHWPTWGNAQVIDFLEKQRDLFKFIHDQSLHLANQGFTMLQIGEKIQLPDSLGKMWYNRGYYGSLNHNSKAVYDFYLGWFSGNPSQLHPLSEVAGSKKYVEYMGGSEEVLKKAKIDFEAGEYRWVAQALNHVVFADPSNQEAKNLLADTLEQLGFQTENGTWRNFYLMGAKELRTGVQKTKGPSATNPDMIIAMPTDDFLDYLAISLDGLKADQHPMTIEIHFLDKKQTYVIQIKNGVLNYYKGKTAPHANLRLSMNQIDMISLFTHSVTVQDLINNKKMKVQGDSRIFEEFFTLFDPFNSWFNIVEPNHPT